MLLLAAGLVGGMTATAQDADNPAPLAQNQGVPGQGPGGPRGGRGFGGMMGGRGMMGTVVEVAPDHFTIKTDAGEVRTVNFSVNTRIMKQPPQRSGGSGERTPPEPIKATDIKVGDAIAASGEMDGAGKSIGAVLVVQLDPERAKQMREMQANFGKTWLMGRVLAVQETKITLQSPVDNAPHTFVADENTSFHRRREFITLADVQVGDNVRVEGAVKEGVFMATGVNVMPAPAAGGRPGPPQAQTPR